MFISSTSLKVEKLLYFFVKKKMFLGVPVMAQQLMNLTGIREDAALIPGLVQWVKDMALA